MASYEENCKRLVGVSVCWEDEIIPVEIPNRVKTTE